MRNTRYLAPFALTAGVVFSALALIGCPPPAVPSGPIGSQVFATEFTGPVALVSARDGTGRLFVVTQPGTIEILDAAGEKLGTFLDIRDRVVPLGAFEERGLLGLAFHPEYARNGRFFVFYIAPAGSDVPPGSQCEVHISEFLVSGDDPNVADPESERVLLIVGKPQNNHNGGQLAFGPDGFLYFGIGDGGGSGDKDAGHTPDTGNGQDLAKLLGKIGRIDVDSGDPYAIPADNPFVDTPGARPEIFAFGFRNPWRFSFDRQTGRLFVGDVGQSVREEVDIVTAGGNYGWRIREGFTCYNVDASSSPLESCSTTDADGRPLLDPILDYPRSQGTSVIGGFVYRGRALPELAGKYVFADLNVDLLTRGRLYVASEGDDGWTFEELLLSNLETGRLGQFVYALGEDADGELYVLVNSTGGATPGAGSIFKIVRSAESE